MSGLLFASRLSLRNESFVMVSARRVITLCSSIESITIYSSTRCFAVNPFKGHELPFDQTKAKIKPMARSINTRRRCKPIYTSPT